MSEPIAFIVPGRPVPKGRPRFTRTGGVYTEERTKDYEMLVATLAKIAMRGRDPIAGPVTVAVLVTLTPPSGANKQTRELALAGGVPAPTGSDVDNCAKSVLDAINKIVYRDDRQVTTLTVSKVYGVEPHVRVAIEEIDTANFRA